jgi:hypothetical protein
VGNPPPDLKSLANPDWLINLVGAFRDRPDLIQMFTNQYLAQVNLERVARLAELSAATAPTRAKVAEAALQKRGSELWLKGMPKSFEGTRGKEIYGIGDNKCNLFVYEMLTQAGARVEMGLREQPATDIQHAYPPLAGQWADPSFPVPGFEVLTVPPDSPQPGDVAAVKHASWDASGHVGIVVGSNKTVSATPEDGVVHNDWGFRPEQEGEVVYRRYVGWPENSGSSPDTSIKTSDVAHETVPPIPEKSRERNKGASPVRGNEK